MVVIHDVVHIPSSIASTLSIIAMKNGALVSGDIRYQRYIYSVLAIIMLICLSLDDVFKCLSATKL